MHVNQIIEASYVDPDVSRRAETLNILLLASFVISILALLSILLLDVMGIFDPSESELSRAQVYAPAVVLSVLLVLLFYLNRKHSSLASSGFLISLTAILSLSDIPEEVADGRGLLFLALPIVMASFVLPPWTSFAFTALVSGVVTIIGATVGVFLTPFSFFAYVVVALVSYLGATQLENALGRLRRINAVLDQRVEERTAELQEANERLRELDRLKSRFVSMVSHELRTPLSAIQGFAEMLLAGIYGPMTEKQEGAIHRIISNTERLLHLVSDLLDQARIEAGQLSIQSRPFSPAELAEDFQSTMNVLAQSKGLVLTTEVAPDVPDRILGDEKRLHQIMINLANNAIKFTDEGSVDLRIYRPDGKDREEKPACWAIKVSDTGPGIPKEDQERIFDPFRRVDDSHTREHLGVGLGLSIVKELIELMGGEISLDSELGEGSTFTIHLPLETQGGQHASAE